MVEGRAYRSDEREAEGYSDGYWARDAQRWVAEPPKSGYRSAFERDRARVLHSSALRRLGDKTQVAAPHSDDFVRTRLTHSLEVAQVGRELGRALGCDPDVVDAACLAHDLGHPPFGHNGEQVLGELADHIGGFEGNAQTLRLLTRLEPKVLDHHGRSVGLNLTRATLDAACKYPWARGRGPEGDESPKFGVYEEDTAVFDWLREDAPEGRTSIEAQLMDLADDISYSVHDVEDAIVAGRCHLGQLREGDTRQRVLEASAQNLTQVPVAEIEQALQELEALPVWLPHSDGSRKARAALKNLTSELIGRFCERTLQKTRERYGPGILARFHAELVLDPVSAVQVGILKGIVATFIFQTEERRRACARQEELIRELVYGLLADAPRGLDVMFAQDWRDARDDDARLRVIVDQVASLTDDSAWALREKLRSGRSGA